MQYSSVKFDEKHIGEVESPNNKFLLSYTKILCKNGLRAAKKRYWPNFNDDSNSTNPKAILTSVSSKS